MHGVLFESTDDTSGLTNNAFLDWRVEQRQVLLDNAVFATLLGVPINDVAPGVLREHGMIVVWVECEFTLIDAGSQPLGLLGGTALAT